jgi:hypothetical protein
MKAFFCDSPREPFPPHPARGERIEVMGLELGRIQKTSSYALPSEERGDKLTWT